MASVHSMVTILAFIGLEHVMVGAQIFVRILKRGRGSLKAKTYSPGEDKYAC